MTKNKPEVNYENEKIEFNFNINEHKINWIKSYKEFIAKYTSKKTWKFHWRYENIRENLLNLQWLLNLKYSHNPDPVEYLLYLYFKKEISVRDISEDLSSFWIVIPDNSLHNLLTKILEIELRDRLAKTESKNNKDIIKWKNNKFNIEKTQETKIAVDKILESNNWKNIWFKRKIYNEKKNKTKKITYLFYKFSFIKEENEDELLNMVSNLHELWFGAHRITNVLLTIINTYIIKNNRLRIPEFKIDPKFIWELLEQKKS
jgi:hypothetical protein